MEEELRVLYVEGLATHDDPESCVDVPRGRGEALAGARVGRAIEPRNHLVRGADVVETAEGTIAAAYWAIRPQAAPGVDGVTWAEYGQDLEACLLYTSDAADEEDSVDLGGRRII